MGWPGLTCCACDMCSGLLALTCKRPPAHLTNEPHLTHPSLPSPPAPQRRTCWRAGTPTAAAKWCAGCAPSPWPSSRSASTSSPAACSASRCGWGAVLPYWVVVPAPLLDSCGGQQPPLRHLCSGPSRSQRPCPCTAMLFFTSLCLKTLAGRLAVRHQQGRGARRCAAPPRRGAHGGLPQVREVPRRSC